MRLLLFAPPDAPRFDRPFHEPPATSLTSGEKGFEVKFVLSAVFVLFAAAAFAQSPSAASRVPPQFFGGVPSGDATSTPITLTILDVINRALEHNLGVVTSESALDQARATRLEALADLLPDLNGHVSETRQKVNLAAFGFPLPAGIPSLVGPFDVFDARVRLSQSVFDLSALRDARAESHNVEAARHRIRGARDLIVLVSANAYLQSLAASARADSARAQSESAEALFNQATTMKEAGLVAGIDVLRAEVQFGTERQRATAARNEFEKSKLALARLIGLPIGQAFTLGENVPFAPLQVMSLDEALNEAYQARPDYLAAQERVRAAEAHRQSVVSEYLPNVQLNADYGRLGLTPSDSAATFSIAGAVNVPIFNGGRTRARLIDADAEVRQRRAEADDMKAEIYYDVKNAFLDLDATREQLEVATRARDLAAQQLTQARDRFAAGVTSNIEIVQAQEAVAQANEQYISALYGYNVAKALLAQGLGVAEKAVRDFLGGIR